MNTDIKKFSRTKYTCYFSYLAMSSIFSLPPLLFVTFREMYGISYTLLGSLVMINFCMQLAIDLIFTFFSRFFPMRITVKVMPFLTCAGLLVYAIVPTLFPQFAYGGLVIGTVIFSVAAGLNEVLLSPLVASLPSDNPERDMSTLHSLYAWGVLFVVIVTTLFLQLFGNRNWMILTLFFAVLPVISGVLFMFSPLPNTENDDEAKKSEKSSGRAFALALCVICIFLGSAAENAMTNWISAFIENALGIPKAWGDVCGLALFALLLGTGRVLYARYGKNISTVLLFGMIGATACYLVAGLSSNLIVAMIACVLTGFCTSMLWPGTLIMMEENIPNVGVTAYALMAAGGDFGGSIAPQLLGAIADGAGASEWAASLAKNTGFTAEQIGMRTGMLAAAIFPLIGAIVLLVIKRTFRKSNAKKSLLGEEEK